MKAIRVHESGGIDTMRLEEVPRPVPAVGEVLVAVKAAGVGPWDRLVREGQSGLGQALPLTLGSEISGTMAALGADVGGFALGDAVYGATNDQFAGGYAEYASWRGLLDGRARAISRRGKPVTNPLSALSLWRLTPGAAVMVATPVLWPLGVMQGR